MLSTRKKRKISKGVSEHPAARRSQPMAPLDAAASMFRSFLDSQRNFPSPYSDAGDASDEGPMYYPDSALRVRRLGVTFTFIFILRPSLVNNKLLLKMSSCSRRWIANFTAAVVRDLFLFFLSCQYTLLVSPLPSCCQLGWGKSYSCPTFRVDEEVMHPNPFENYVAPSVESGSATHALQF